MRVLSAAVLAVWALLAEGISIPLPASSVKFQDPKSEVLHDSAPSQGLVKVGDSVRKLADGCKLVIKVTAAGHYLHFGEVSITDSAGARVVQSSAALSTTYTPNPSAVDRCFDGDVNTWCGTADVDSAPTLTVNFPCASGSASGYTAKVTNRVDCCRERVGGGTLQAYNSDGSAAGAYTFAASQADYTIPLGQAGNCGSLGYACNSAATCIAGACICNLGTTWNGSACTSTAGTSATCGTLGYACNSVAQCINGACVCNAGTEWDGKVCAPTSLPGNCGNLGYACNSAASCSNGACVCNPGTAWDGSACTASTTVVPSATSGRGCAKNSYGRGAGVVLNSCPDWAPSNEAGTCLSRCPAGYHGVGFLCSPDCPANFLDIGAFCQKPASYGRGGGYANFFWDPAMSHCERDNGVGNCEWWGAMTYPKCASGFVPFGCCTCTPACPNGMADTGTGCTKSAPLNRYSSALICGADQEQNGLLCYPKCSASTYGVGPACWQRQCSGAFPADCGLGLFCGRSAADCAEINKYTGMSIALSMATAVGGAACIAAIVATGGAATPLCVKNFMSSATTAASIAVFFMENVATMCPA